jgi:putative hydrolase of HD superfamily
MEEIIKNKSIPNSLLLKIYDAAGMQRWNDQIRAIEMTELDKQAHKMITAYVMGKIQQEEKNRELNWIDIIEYGLFEFLQRIILTDLKPPLFYEIMQDREKYKKLNQWVFEKIYPDIKSLGSGFCNNFRKYITGGTDFNENYPDVSTAILGAAHFYVTKWEFKLIERFNPQGYQVEEIRKNIDSQQEKYCCLPGVKKFLESQELMAFIDICGQLRFQVRWSHLYRVPKTSVLGHMLVVAIYSYLFSYILGFDRERMINNYFTGLFHDLPEVLTRDIINPVKKSVEGLDELIKDYEKSEMEKKIYKLLPVKWHSDIRMFTESEFEDIKTRDGKLVKAADDLAAFIEAYLSIKNGIKNDNLIGAMENLRRKYKDVQICGLDFNSIYKGFPKAL